MEAPGFTFQMNYVCESPCLVGNQPETPAHHHHQHKLQNEDNFEAEIAVGRQEFKAGMGIITHKCSIKKNSSQAGYGKEVPMKLGVGCRLSKERTHPC